jgi:hypothetical protein
MMEKPRILVDKTELVLIVESGKSYSVVNLQQDEISRIQFDAISEYRLFRKVPSESIRIFSGKSPEPYTYKRCKNRAYWEDYKKKLAEFAGRNTVTFTDNLRHG